MRLCRALLRGLGWRVVRNLPPGGRCVVVGAWHTSNWDFVLAVLAGGAMGVGLHFLGKRELLDAPYGPILRRLGVIPVDRSRRSNFTARVAELYEEHEVLRVVVPAEGTRGATDTWRTGFYYMALAAGVPIAFGVIDAGERVIGIDGWFYPTGERDADLARVAAYYEGKRGVRPANMGPVRFQPPREPHSHGPDDRADPPA